MVLVTVTDTRIYWISCKFTILYRFSRCFTNEDMARELSHIEKIEVKDDSLGIGTPGRDLLQKLWLLSSSDSMISKIALKVSCLKKTFLLSLITFFC